PIFAGDQDRRVRRRYSFGEIEHFHERAIAPDGPAGRRAVAAPDLAAQRAVLALQLARFGRPAAERDEFAVHERLLEVVERALVHGLDRGLERCLRRHEDDRRLGVALADLRQEVEARDAGHADVRQHHVGRRLLEPFQRLAAALRGRDLEALAAQQDLQRIEDRDLVVYDQYPGHTLLTPLAVGRQVDGEPGATTFSAIHHD